jgi:CheY-like chemotaxis protein
VLDLLMPGMTGFEFLDQLRASPAARSIPAIVWTVAKGTEGHARVLAELASALPNHARGRA